MFYLGIDLGGTYVKAGIVDHEGNILVNDQVATEVSAGLDKMLLNIIFLAKKMMEEGKKDNLHLEAVGIGIPGPVDEHGTVIRCVNLGLIGVPIAKILSKALGLPVYAGNDGNIAGIGEFAVGALAGVQDGIAIMVGTGIGGGIITNGKIQTGVHNIGAEIGHMIVGENFYDCNCGRNGCLETFSSAKGLIAYTRKLLDSGRESNLHNLCHGNLEKIDGAMIMKAAQEGDFVAKEAVERAALYLGKGIINLVAILDPERIVIGGGVSKSGDWFLDKVRAAADQERYFREFPLPEIVLAKFGNEAGIVGAAMLAKTNLEEDKAQRVMAG